MTAISFKSDSGDDYLEISENESLDEFISSLARDFGEEWFWLNICCIKSTDFSEKEIQLKLEEYNLGNQEGYDDEEE